MEKRTGDLVYCEALNRLVYRTPQAGSAGNPMPLVQAAGAG